MILKRTQGSVDNCIIILLFWQYTLALYNSSTSQDGYVTDRIVAFVVCHQVARVKLHSTIISCFIFATSSPWPAI